MSNLFLRQPAGAWLTGAVLAATVLHGLCWFVVLVLMGAPSLTELQRQIVLSLFWMAGALVLWRISGAQSRLHATFTVLGCALFVTTAGSLAAFAKLYFIDRIIIDAGFVLLSVLLALGQLALAVPSSVLLQAVALTRKAPAQAVPHPASKPTEN